MDLAALWPPKRGLPIIYDRLRHGRAQFAAEYYQRRHAGVPWMPQSGVEILDDMLKPTDRLLEWGSGASTTWFAARCQRVLSVEHDASWYERVRSSLAAQQSDVNSVRLLSLEPCDRPNESPYVRAIDDFADGELDVVFVDGEHRPTCAIESVAKLSSGGLIVIDDAQSFLDHASSTPYHRHGQGAAGADWSRFAELVADWRLIWTGDGYSDAAIYIKP